MNSQEYEKELKEQIDRTKDIVKVLRRVTKQVSTIWYIAAYMAIIVSIMLIKMIWW